MYFSLFVIFYILVWVLSSSRDTCHVAYMYACLAALCCDVCVDVIVVMWSSIGAVYMRMCVRAWQPLCCVCVCVCAVLFLQRLMSVVPPFFFIV